MYSMFVLESWELIEKIQMLTFSHPSSGRFAELQVENQDDENQDDKHQTIT